jgi:hypothetical protein
MKSAEPKFKIYVCWLRLKTYILFFTIPLQVEIMTQGKQIARDLSRTFRRLIPECLTA